MYLITYINVRFNPWKKITIFHECLHNRTCIQKYKCQYTLNTQMLFHANIYPEDIKKHLYLVYRKGLQHPWKIYWNSHSLLYFQVNLLVKQQPSKFLREVAAALWKTVFWVLHTVLSPSDKQSSQCQPHFLPSNLPCGLLLCGGAHKQSIEKKTKNCSNGWLWWCPVHVWGYTPSSMPIKSEPFCIVMEAPAALSTNMEVYCPACRGKYTTVMQKDCTHIDILCLCVS